MSDDLATYLQTYTMRAQHAPDRAMTRYRHDVAKMVENNEISTGPGRYRLGVPNAYGNAVFVPDPTIRQQFWGASHDMTSTKTDVESDLRNLARPTTRGACGQYRPEEGAARAARLTAMPEADFPQTHARLVDPPCTLRSTGWNRWEWLCQNPQAGVMMPFEWNVDSRVSAKDGVSDVLAQKGCPAVGVVPAVPVARVPGAKDAPNFTDAIPGVSQRPAVGAPPAARVRSSVGAPPVMGSDHPDAPPRGPVGNPLDRARAESGMLEAPAPFTAFIVRPSETQK